ncbi:MAG: hypothetical protein C4K47_01780 [Candidatus Thorarchaeota archaeon]|nr:MAG: hypothetical protein C4K47_01780 [Candidatus Thorarchaeota archaeon]
MPKKPEKKTPPGQAKKPAPSPAKPAPAAPAKPAPPPAKPAPAPAPTPAGAFEKWECQVCGYIYDEAKGDPDGGIKPGTKFSALPDDWVCPMCGASKEDFEKVK